MSKFSRISLLGDFRLYSRAQFIQLLPDYSIRVLYEDSAEALLRFQGDGVILDLLFSADGKFLRVVREEWVNIGVMQDLHVKKH